MALTDPRQAMALSYYKNPKSETFGDLANSMKRAGYSPKSLSGIYSKPPAWLTQNTFEDVKAIKRAETNLRRYNDMNIEPDGIKSKTDIEKAKIQLDASKFILKTQAKQKYNDTDEVEAPNVQVNIINYNDEAPKVEAKVLEAEVVED